MTSSGSVIPSAARNPQYQGLISLPAGLKRSSPGGFSKQRTLLGMTSSGSVIPMAFRSVCLRVVATRGRGTIFAGTAQGLFELPTAGEAGQPFQEGMAPWSRRSGSTRSREALVAGRSARGSRDSLGAGAVRPPGTLGAGGVLSKRFFERLRTGPPAPRRGDGNGAPPAPGGEPASRSGAPARRRGSERRGRSTATRSPPEPISSRPARSGPDARTLAKAGLAQRAASCRRCGPLAHQAAARPRRAGRSSSRVLSPRGLLPAGSVRDAALGRAARRAARSSPRRARPDPRRDRQHAAGGCCRRAGPKAAAVPVVISSSRTGRESCSGRGIAGAAPRSRPRAGLIGINCVAAARLAGDLALLAAALPGIRSPPTEPWAPVEGPGWSLHGRVEPDDYARQAQEWMASASGISAAAAGRRSAHTRALRGLLDAA